MISPHLCNESFSGYFWSLIWLICLRNRGILWKLWCRPATECSSFTVAFQGGLQKSTARPRESREESIKKPLFLLNALVENLVVFFFFCVAFFFWRVSWCSFRVPKKIASKCPRWLRKKHRRATELWIRMSLFGWLSAKEPVHLWTLPVYIHTGYELYNE